MDSIETDEGSAIPMHDPAHNATKAAEAGSGEVLVRLTLEQARAVDADPTHPLRAEYEAMKLECVRAVLFMIGEDPLREGLKETPARVAKAWREWFGGYAVDPNSLFKTFEDGAPGELNDQMLLEVDIPVFSWCEHHMAPIIGVAHVAYIPQAKIVGLSKLVRVVNAFAHRLQVQERMTNQIADCIQANLNPTGVGVVITAEHFCMSTRGVHTPGVKTTTSALRGAILNEIGARQEFFNLIAMTKRG